MIQQAIITTMKEKMESMGYTQGRQIHIVKIEQYRHSTVQIILSSMLLEGGYKT